MKNQKKVIKINAKKQKEINLFDLVSVIIVIFLVGLFIYGRYVYKPIDLNQKIYLTVRVPAEDIEDEAAKQKYVYLNSVNKPVEVRKIYKERGDLFIVLYAPGKIEGEVYIFNGQRVLINQKAEIHSSYFAQGKIISVSNEFK